MIEKLVEKAKENLTPRKITLFVVGHSVRFVVSAAVSSIVHDDEDQARDKARIFIGSYVIAGMLSDKAEEWTEQKIDIFVEEWNNAEPTLKIAEVPAE